MQLQKTMLRSIYLIHMITFKGKNKLLLFLCVSFFRSCKENGTYKSSTFECASFCLHIEVSVYSFLQITYMEV